MARWGWVALASLIVSIAFTASAQGASVVYIKKNDVWMARADGSGKVRITRDGRPGNYYFSPSIADDGTIVALKTIFLHSFRPNGRRIVKPRQWAIDPSPALSTEPFSVDLARNGKIVATENGVYSTFYDPRVSEDRPTLSAKFIDFFKFRGTPKEVGRTDGLQDWDLPAWIDSKRLLTTTYNIFGAQIVEARIGQMTSGTDFYRDPGRDPATGTNSFILSDAEMTRAGDRFAVMRRPLLGSSSDDPSVGTIQIYRTGNPPSASTPLCSIGPGRRIPQQADPSWTPDGKTLLWWEVGRGIFSTRVTSAPGCGIKPRLIVRGGLKPDVSKANLPRRRRSR